MVDAKTAVLAGVRAALVDVSFAPLAPVTGQAVADELVHAVLAGTAVHARTALALVHVAQAPGVVVAAWTLAPETVDQVDARAPVGTGVARTLIDVGLAVLACETGLAIARVPVIQ